MTATLLITVSVCFITIAVSILWVLCNPTLGLQSCWGTHRPVAEHHAVLPTSPQQPLPSSRICWSRSDPRRRHRITEGTHKDHRDQFLNPQRTTQNQTLCLRPLSKHSLNCVGLMLRPLPWGDCSRPWPHTGEESFPNIQLDPPPTPHSPTYSTSNN